MFTQPLNKAPTKIFLQREGQRLSIAGALFIGALWLLMLSCVVVSASGLLHWLDALYIISYTTIIGAFVKYIPLVRLDTLQ